MEATDVEATSEPKGNRRAQAPRWRLPPLQRAWPQWPHTTEAAELLPGVSPGPDASAETNRAWLCSASLGAEVLVTRGL